MGLFFFSLAICIWLFYCSVVSQIAEGCSTNIGSICETTSLQIGSSLGNSRQLILTEYLHSQLLQELAVMFGSNGHFLACNIFTESIPAERLLGNKLIMEGLQCDKNA
jgi:hypothetical protein